jgi:hypothetical protein
VGITSATNVALQLLDMIISGEFSFSDIYLSLFHCHSCALTKKIYHVVAFRPGACDLFSREEIDRWEALMNPGRGRVQAEAPAPAPLPRGRYCHSCPTCGAAKPKVT